MVSLNNILERRESILRIAQRRGARHVRVFGSVARGEAGDDSDVDLLVSIDEDRSLIDHVALAQDLEDFLGCKVDVVNERALNHRISRRVHAEAVPL
jgi:hypothetical protein